MNSSNQHMFLILIEIFFWTLFNVVSWYWISSWQVKGQQRLSTIEISDRNMEILLSNYIGFIVVTWITHLDFPLIHVDNVAIDSKSRRILILLGLVTLNVVLLGLHGKLHGQVFVELQTDIFKVENSTDFPRESHT